MSADIFAGVSEVLTQQFHVEADKVRPDAALTDLDLDSLSLMEFVFAVEDRFGVRIPEKDLDPRRADATLQQVCDALAHAVSLRAV